MDVVQHQILSLDFWQDTVSYEGKNFPSGTIGCDALNIPAALIKQITELCGSLNLFMGAMQLGMANAELFTSARESALQIVHKLILIQLTYIYIKILAHKNLRFCYKTSYNFIISF